MNKTQSQSRILPTTAEPRQKPGVSRLTHLSIRQRLPLLMAALLFGVIAAATWTSYREVRQSARTIGQERLLHLTQQFATLLQQSSAKLNDKTFSVANEHAIRSVLQSASSTTRADALDALKQFAVPQDPNGWQVEVWDANRSLVLTWPDNSKPEPSDLKTEFNQCNAEPFKAAGAIRVIGDVVAYPSLAAVKNDNGNVVGYLVRWRKLSSTPEARKQLTDLLGSEATLYFGNSRADVWTDLGTTVSKPPVPLPSTLQVTTYKRDGDSVMALGRPIIGTPWFVLVEIPERVVLVQAGAFLRRMILVGLVLFAAGVASAFMLSRGITRPLRSLTEAASSISRGDYSRVVNIRRSDELGELACAFNVMTDRVCESQRDLELKIKERTADLEASNKELESFSYSVSHDLRAPLRAIDGFSRILVEEHSHHLNSDATRVLEIIRTNTQQMGRLIDDLLAFSRLGRKSIEPSPVDMEELARDALSQIGATAPEFTAHFELGRLAPTQGDKPMLRQVFVNLLSNAAKYSRGKGTPLIEVGGFSQNGHNGYYVKDNGVGFDMKYANKLFGVFQRLHSPEEFEGTGVGLAIVQRIINRHGGRIWAESEIDRGATFYFTLPRGRDETDGSVTA